MFTVHSCIDDGMMISYGLDDTPQRLWGYLHTKSSPYGEMSVLHFTQYEAEEVRHGILGVLRKWDFIFWS